MCPHLYLLCSNGDMLAPGVWELLGWGFAGDNDGAENPCGSLHEAPILAEPCDNTHEMGELMSKVA